MNSLNTGHLRDQLMLFVLERWPPYIEFEFGRDQQITDVYLKRVDLITVFQNSFFPRNYRLIPNVAFCHFKSIILVDLNSRLFSLGSGFSSPGI